MKIAIYAKDADSDILRLTMAYCQRWDCYPAIEHYSKREELLDAIKNRNIDIAILRGSRHEGDSIVGETEKMEMMINFIWILPDYFQDVNPEESARQKQQCSVVLTQKIEKGLAACGIPSIKESLCRVHLIAE